MYDIYLGGLDIEKFPRLFKRAIPFRMNIKLEDFVKEYICMEQDMHIEELQESVTQYGRMRGKIEETMDEIGYLQDIEGAYHRIRKRGRETCFPVRIRLQGWKCCILQSKVRELSDRMQETKAEIADQEAKSRSGNRAGKPSKRV